MKVELKKAGRYKSGKGQLFEKGVVYEMTPQQFKNIPEVDRELFVEVKEQSVQNTGGGDTIVLPTAENTIEEIQAWLEENEIDYPSGAKKEVYLKLVEEAQED